MRILSATLLGLSLAGPAAAQDLKDLGNRLLGRPDDRGTIQRDQEYQRNDQRRDEDRRRYDEDRGFDRDKRHDERRLDRDDRRDRGQYDRDHPRPYDER